MSELIDNQAHRVRTLKHLITRLHHGESPEAVRPMLATLVRECNACDVAAMEQELIADGMPVADIMSMCDLHSQVLRDVIVEAPRPVPPGHPVDTFRRENDALRQTCAKLRALGALAGATRDDAPIDAARHDAFRRAFNELMDVEKHYLRKEHLLFPYLERCGITGPSKVMWGKDDEVRGLLRDLGTALAESDVTAGDWRVVMEVLVSPALASIEEMVVKEEKVLLPMSLERLTEADWGEIWAQSPQIGWCLVDPRTGWEPPRRVPAASDAAAATAESRGAAFEPSEDTRAAVPGPVLAGAIVLPTGSITLDQLTAVFKVLPVDLTFVDADDRVRFFTEGTSRVFHRARAVIGRKVQHCHPPASVDVVDRILRDFREGREDVAAFWINFRGRFVHIRYFAVRDGAQQYLGTLEVTQDLTGERALEGERRLLAYD